MDKYHHFIEKIVTNPKNHNFLGFTIVRNILTLDEVKHLREVVRSTKKAGLIDEDAS